MAVKTYVLEIMFDDETDECLGLREYVEADNTVIQVDDSKLKLDKKLGRLIIGNIMGIS